MIDKDKNWYGQTLDFLNENSMGCMVLLVMFIFSLPAIIAAFSGKVGH